MKKQIGYLALALVSPCAQTSQLPPVLAPSTKRLTFTRAGGVETEVYLCGTAHVSSRSCEEVSQLIRAVQPDVVLVELCSQRLSMLKGQELNTSTQWLTLRATFAAVRRGEAGLLEGLLMWMQAQSARLLKVLPGEEFRVALTESRATQADFLLFDRPCQVTLRRM